MAATNTIRLIDAAASGHRPDRDAALGLVAAPLAPLMEAAETITVDGFGRSVSYSRKVFIPLTQLCRDVCHYCTFAKAPRRLAQPYLAPEEVLAIARAGQAQGCKEALFTLGDKPELRYSVARRALESKGLATTLEYLEQMAGLVFRETGLLPHLNPGSDGAGELTRLRTVSVSMGVMLETASERLSLARRAALRLAGQAARAAARDASCRRRAGDPVHKRPVDRHWRNTPGAHRIIAGPARPA